MKNLGDQLLILDAFLKCGFFLLLSDKDIIFHILEKIKYNYVKQINILLYKLNSPIPLIPFRKIKGELRLPNFIVTASLYSLPLAAASFFLYRNCFLILMD
jgi:hypothetical protein